MVFISEINTNILNPFFFWHDTGYVLLASFMMDDTKPLTGGIVVDVHILRHYFSIMTSETGMPATASSPFK